MSKALETDHIISLGAGRPPRASCTCGWSVEPNKDLFELGASAFKHRDETGHQLRKPPEEEDYS